MIKSIESDKFKVQLVDSDYYSSTEYRVVDLETGRYITVTYSELHELIELLKKVEEIF